MTDPVLLARGEVPAGVPAAFRLGFAMASRIRHGTLDVELPDGRRFRIAGPEPGPHGTLAVRRPRAGRRYVLGGQIGWAESYMDGDWDTPDLAALLELFNRNHAAIAATYSGGSLYNLAQRVVHLLRANTRRGARRNIARHYDLGNAFYQRWLDPSMTYSSAVFPEGTRDLTAAQLNKYRLIADKLGVGPGRHVLEIGCGWGGFASYLAREHGCRVTAITVSAAQAEFAAARMQRDGVNDRVNVKLIDYRDVPGRYDAVASIEMFEAVGEKYWPAFFGKLRDSLVPGGRASLQIITIADQFFDSYRRNVDFIQRYIFPGGMLPSPAALARETMQAGLRIERQDFFGHHYAETLAAWNRAFQAAWPEIARMNFDRRFKRMWEYYLAYCEAGFRARSIDLTQVALARG